MSKQEKVAVTFLKHWRGYNPTETAGFDAELADRLVQGKVAEKAGTVTSNRGSGRASRSDEKSADKVSKAAAGSDTQGGTAKSSDGTGGIDGASGGTDDRP